MQHLTTIRPMHLDFAEPSKCHADLILPRGGKNHIDMEMIVRRIQRTLQQN